MSKKIPITTFVSELAAALNRGDGYIMASYGQNPRTGYLDLKETKVKSGWKEDGWYYTQYSGSQRAQALKWRKQCARVWDCNGLAEGIYEIHTGVCINARARNNYASWCSVKGSGVIPAKYRVPGAAVFWSNSGASSIHHVAYLWKPVVSGKPEGDWYLIEARGVMYGVVKSKLLSRKPNYWGWMDKYFEYQGTGNIAPSAASAEGASAAKQDAPETRGQAERQARGEGQQGTGETQGTGENQTGEADEMKTVSVVPLLGSRILRNGSEGADVKEMQAGLIRLGYDLGPWGADGDFGDQTEMAVRAFQRDHSLEIDGEFGPLSLAALEAALAALEHPAENPRSVEIVDGDCYVRDAPSTAGRILGVARRGEKLPFGGTVDEATRWLSVRYRDAAAWVSGRYGRLAA